MAFMYNDLHTFIAFLFVSIYLFCVEFINIFVCIFKYQFNIKFVFILANVRQNMFAFV